MKIRFAALIATALCCFGIAITGCEREEKQAEKPAAAQTQAGAKQSQAAALPSGLFVSEAIAGARGVGEVKADAAATGDVVVRGRIGGRKDPFVDGVAMFVLADVAMKACNELHGDGCRTPWDYCCEPRESLMAKTATVQIVDAAGAPLRLSLKGQHGLDPLAELTIAGKVAKRDKNGMLVINATKIHVKATGG